MLCEDGAFTFAFNLNSQWKCSKSLCTRRSHFVFFVSPKHSAYKRRICKPEINDMKLPPVKNTVVDEVHELTYVVTAPRVLTDGEMYSAIRIALLKRQGKRPEKGETLEIASTFV